MKMLGASRKHGTELFSVIADRDDVIDFLSDELINGFRAVAGNIDANFLHDRDCFRANSGGASASRKDLETITGHLRNKPFRHLAPCGIPRAEDQDGLFVSTMHSASSLQKAANLLCQSPFPKWLFKKIDRIPRERDEKGDGPDSPHPFSGVPEIKRTDISGRESVSFTATSVPEEMPNWRSATISRIGPR